VWERRDVEIIKEAEGRDPSRIRITQAHILKSEGQFVAA
jgi:hypothetical protein